ncbi:hypothetical protein [Paramicrobacterium agarici]|uniref:Uncharacterized protein n=1 Tax=Paramicrobacterium agarici TaxID=630514 RepID=A0A2A9DUT0_9MICO|nr:hypothetical protein [Microbacterium agarici]PFG29700.1 hypothetical protein ATJ78_0615 [Microbacterium agarici]
MYASPELYYDIEYRQHERALENAAAYRRAAEFSPGQVSLRTPAFARLVTWLRGVATARRERRRGGGIALDSVETRTSAAPALPAGQSEPNNTRVDAVA